MKIIDILAEKERPDKFMYDSLIYTRKANGSYIDDDGDNLLEVIFDDYSNINDEVKVIEEEKKPLTKQDVEALGYACGEIQKCFTNGWNKSLENKPFKEDKKIEKLKENESIENDTGTCLRNITNKINELIDKLNSLENKQ